MKADVEKHRHDLIEKIAENDDAVMSDYLDGKEISIEDLRKTLRKAVIANTIIPVMCGSALKNKGVQFMLDAVIEYLPSPADMPPIMAHDEKTGEQVAVKLTDEENFAGLAFKIATDPFVGNLAFFRCYAGVLRRGSYVYNSTKGVTERIGRIVRMHANDSRRGGGDLLRRDCGDRGIEADDDGGYALRSGTRDHPRKDHVPEPVIGLRIEPKTKADQEKMGTALHRLAEEDRRSAWRAILTRARRSSAAWANCTWRSSWIA